MENNKELLHRRLQDKIYKTLTADDVKLLKSKMRVLKFELGELEKLGDFLDIWSVLEIRGHLGCNQYSTLKHMLREIRHQKAVNEVMKVEKEYAEALSESIKAESIATYDLEQLEKRHNQLCSAQQEMLAIMGSNHQQQRLCLDEQLKDQEELLEEMRKVIERQRLQIQQLINDHREGEDKVKQYMKQLQTLLGSCCKVPLGVQYEPDKALQRDLPVVGEDVLQQLFHAVQKLREHHEHQELQMQRLQDIQQQGQNLLDLQNEIKQRYKDQKNQLQEEKHKDEQQLKLIQQHLQHIHERQRQLLQDTEQRNASQQRIQQQLQQKHKQADNHALSKDLGNEGLFKSEELERQEKRLREIREESDIVERKIREREQELNVLEQQVQEQQMEMENIKEQVLREKEVQEREIEERQEELRRQEKKLKDQEKMLEEREEKEKKIVRQQLDEHKLHEKAEVQKLEEMLSEQQEVDKKIVEEQMKICVQKKKKTNIQQIAKHLNTGGDTKASEDDQEGSDKMVPDYQTNDKLIQLNIKQEREDQIEELRRELEELKRSLSQRDDLIEQQTREKVVLEKQMEEIKAENLREEEKKKEKLKRLQNELVREKQTKLELQTKLEENKQRNQDKECKESMDESINELQESEALDSIVQREGEQTLEMERINADQTEAMHQKHSLTNDLKQMCTESAHDSKDSLEGTHTATGDFGETSNSESPCDEKNSTLYETSLMLACNKGHISIIKYFIGNGGDVNIRNPKGETPLHKAAGGGYMEAVNLLLKAGAKTDTGDYDGQTALHYASFWGHLEIVNSLLQTANTSLTTDSDGNTPLHLAAASYKTNVEVLHVLLQSGIPVNKANVHGKTPLHKAIGRFCHEDTVKVLLEAGADTSLTDMHGQTALHYAAALGYLNIVILLLHSASREATFLKDNDGNTAVMLAKHNRRDSVVTHFMERHQQSS